MTGALLALSAACGPLPAGSGPGKGGAPPKAGKSASPARPGSPAPGATATADASASPMAAAGSPGALAGAPTGKLTRPAEGTIAIAGRVKVDAAYAAARGGTLLSDRGAGILANNGGAVVALGARLDGGRLLANNGGGVIADGGGNMVAPGSAGIAGDLGGGLLVANNGSALVANNGSALVANNGGALIAKNQLRLLQAAAPVAGAEAAAAGMLVAVVSLRDRRYLPLGIDASGRPVYAVYSNAEGAYEVFVPAAEQGNLLVVVGPPGSPDRRLAYNLVTPATNATNAQVDELSALSTRYLRGSFTGRLADLVLSPEFAKAMLVGEPTMAPAAKDVMIEAIDLLAGAAARAGVDSSADPAELRAKAQRIVDAGLADMDLEAIMADASVVTDWRSPPKPAMAAMRAGLGQLVSGTAERLAADPAHFSMAFLENTINGPFEDGEPMPALQGTYEILKPADFGEFMLSEYFGRVRVGTYTCIERAFRTALGSASPRVADPDPAIEARVAEANNEFRGAVGAVIHAICRRITEDPALVIRAEEIFKTPVTP